MLHVITQLGLLFMLKDHQLSPPDILKRFDFLNVDTPAAREWVRRYLLKQKQIQITEYSPSMENIKLVLSNHIQAHHLSASDIKNLSRAMGNAWRVMRHRKEKKIGTLSVSMPKAVLNQLDEMCRGQKKAEILTLLINGGYEKFLASKQELKAKKAEKNLIKQMALEHKKLELRLKRPPTTEKDSQAIQELQVQNDDLTHCIATLYDLIYLANERDQYIDTQKLIEATKLYYSAFSK
ncbi:hypothetical protein AYJ01_03930 [Shewanella algae]|nr:hypothetical protein AYJ01_03930 [Shewanella algae]